MYYQLFDNLQQIFEESDFDSAFQPVSPEEYDERLKQKIERLAKEQSWIQNPDGSYSCEGTVYLFDLHLTKLPVTFKEVRGHFYCFHNQLTSLQGAPAHVGGDFSCSQNNLTSLQGAPAHVRGNFFCRGNRLTSLQGAPAHVGGYFDCYRNPVPEQQLKQTVKRDYL